MNTNDLYDFDAFFKYAFVSHAAHRTRPPETDLLPGLFAQLSPKVQDMWVFFRSHYMNIADVPALGGRYQIDAYSVRHNLLSIREDGSNTPSALSKGEAKVFLPILVTLLQDCINQGADRAQAARIEKELSRIRIAIQFSTTGPDIAVPLQLVKGIMSLRKGCGFPEFELRSFLPYLVMGWLLHVRAY